MLWVKTLPCLMAGVWGKCEGAVEADHAGMRGMGRKCPDTETIPLCHAHHHGGRFPRMVPKPLRREWLDAAVAYVQVKARLYAPTCVGEALPSAGNISRAWNEALEAYVQAKMAVSTYAAKG